jgi:hypothetical protein
MSKKYLLFLLLFLFNVNILSQVRQEELNQASEYFREAKTISDNDKGNIWGVTLYGPMLFVNSTTRFIIANEPDKDNFLKKNGDVYCGTLPIEMNISNTALNWKEKKWTMLIWPLPETKSERETLLMHELFHRIQDKINLPMHDPLCNHLDQKDGRILIRLEWRELISALHADKQKRAEYVRNALILNKYRKELYPGADSLETQLEKNEGLAEYTGLKLCGAALENIVEYLTQKVDKIEKVPSLIRSFAYISGPLYCFLLDGCDLPWRNSISGKKSLPDLLSDIYSNDLKNDIKEEAKKFLNSNMDSGIIKYEELREKQQVERIQNLRDKFTNKPVIVVPFQNMNMQFSPGNLIPLENIGTVYPNIRISDNWGILNVTNEGMISEDWKFILISVPEDFNGYSGKEEIKSKDWTLKLNKGWSIGTVGNKGNYILRKDN